MVQVYRISLLSYLYYHTNLETMTKEQQKEFVYQIYAGLPISPEFINVESRELANIQYNICGIYKSLDCLRELEAEPLREGAFFPIVLAPLSQLHDLLGFVDIVKEKVAALGVDPTHDTSLTEDFNMFINKRISALVDYYKSHEMEKLHASSVSPAQIENLLAKMTDPNLIVALAAVEYLRKVVDKSRYLQFLHDNLDSRYPSLAAAIGLLDSDSYFPENPKLFERAIEIIVAAKKSTLQASNDDVLFVNIAELKDPRKIVTLLTELATVGVFYAQIMLTVIFGNYDTRTELFETLKSDDLDIAKAVDKIYDIIASSKSDPEISTYSSALKQHMFLRPKTPASLFFDLTKANYYLEMALQNPMISISKREKLRTTFQTIKDHSLRHVDDVGSVYGDTISV